MMKIPKSLVAIIASAGIILSTACTPKVHTGFQFPMKWGQVYFSSNLSEKYLSEALCKHVGISNCEKDWGKAVPGHYIDVVKIADKNNDGLISEKEAKAALDYFNR